MDLQTAIFGAGCFWGVEARFAALEGVVDTTAGYAGGASSHPTYDQVCTGSTGHAEVVKVTFRPDRITFDQLLDMFFAIHNPRQPYLSTSPNSRSQYRSLILTTDPAQAAIARQRIQRLEDLQATAPPLRTAVEPAGAFWPAEEFHQRYLEKRHVTPVS